MEKIDIKEYFTEIIDEGRSTIGYDCVPYKTNELVHKIYKQNGELKRLKQENAELKEKVESYICNANCYKYKEANKYRQALEEIREIAEKRNYLNLDEALDDILDKINEVLDV